MQLHAKHLTLSLILLFGLALGTNAQKRTMKRPFRYEMHSKITKPGKWNQDYIHGVLVDSIPENYYFACIFHNSCKGISIQYFRYPLSFDTGLVLTALVNRQRLVIAKKPQLTIKGNILYDVNYRSNIDTPYAEKNVYQHTIQTYLDLTWKDNYPFRVYFTHRFSNSPLFRNYSDLNFQFNPNEFSNKVKAQLLALLMKSVKLDTLDALKKMLDQKTREFTTLQNWVNDPGQLQKLVASRERQLMKYPDSLPQIPDKNIPDNKANMQGLLPNPRFKTLENKYTDSIKNKLTTDSLNRKTEKFDSIYLKKKNRMDSLLTELKKLDSSYQHLMQLQHYNLTLLKREIEETNTVAGIKDKLEKMHTSDTLLPKGYKTLFALKSLGLGRSIADYSELSAKNISINGLQAEYNPRLYYAFAAGIVDYRFRDYIVYNAQQQKQYLALVRVGKGVKDGNHLIFTYYTGKRQLYNASANAQANAIPNYNLMGFTIESRFNINRNNYFTAEIAKSSLPYYSLDSTKGRNLAGNLTKLNDRTNEAYALKLVSFIPRTQTSISGSFRRTGSNFQSFSLFTTGAAQTAWSVKLEQPFFKRKLTVVASLRENDFVNSFTNTAFQSNMLVKTIQATMRIKKWPVVSVGYFPSSQLTKLSNNSFAENLFYTLVGSANHYYRIKNTQLNTTLVYTQFYNKSSDSGFVYFNTRNVLLSQTVFAGKSNLQLNLSAAANTNYRLYVLEPHIEYSINKWLGLGAGIKYNYQTSYNITQWGYAGNARLAIPKFGNIQLTMDNGFLPGINRQLVENKLGRLTYFKSF
jgi:hypothetical protein